jgi:hypothetical protein
MTAIGYVTKNDSGSYQDQPVFHLGTSVLTTSAQPDRSRTSGSWFNASRRHRGGIEIGRRGIRFGERALRSGSPASAVLRERSRTPVSTRVAGYARQRPSMMGTEAAWPPPAQFARVITRIRFSFDECCVTPALLGRDVAPFQFRNCRVR